MEKIICGTPPSNWVGRNDGQWEAGYLTAVRNTCPTTAQGYTANDVDLCIRTFEPSGDQTGKFFLTEFKHSKAGLTGSQRRLFGMMDEMLRKGDCELYDCGRYLGFFLIQYDKDCWHLDCADVDQPGHQYLINGSEISLENALGFLCGRLEIEAEPLIKPKVALTWAELR